MYNDKQRHRRSCRQKIDELGKVIQRAKPVEKDR
jgi:hypothetical protein